MVDFIYLASQSPRRRQLLEQLGVRLSLLLPDDSDAAEALEAVRAGEAPATYVRRVTRLKLDDAVLRLAEQARPAAPVLCADTTVALDERGSALTTSALAAKLSQWQGQGGDVALLIGGPDGLHPALRQAAHERIRLSDLTLPHAMVRVLLIEQLYRAWSVNAGHPYHRE